MYLSPTPVSTEKHHQGVTRTVAVVSRIILLVYPSVPDIDMGISGWYTTVRLIVWFCHDPFGDLSRFVVDEVSPAGESGSRRMLSDRWRHIS